LTLIAFCAGLAACGGAAAPSVLIQVAGVYDIQKTFTEDTCGSDLAGRVVTNPGDVSHEPGASSFLLTDHGTRTLRGSVSSDGSFQLEASSGIVHGSIPAVDTFSAGRFTATGFHVHDVTELSATASSAACRLVEDWDATKVGPPNVIP
jgi:hypothetical protein